jgi:hypothetical protein
MQAENGHSLACGLFSLTHHPTFSKFYPPQAGTSTHWE